MNIVIHYMSLQFCPKCSTLMSHDKANIVCSQCGEKAKMKSGKVKSTIYSTKTTITVNDGVVYDMALKKTCKVVCSNGACDSNSIEKWGQRTEDGFLIQPDMLIMNYHDKADRTNTYICCVCKTLNAPHVS
jgi:DNA-directed RNA polymerase subunit M/transcription elongation factor TFIIS